MRITGLLLLLIPCAAAISRHPVCSEYGLNWAAEIRCLRNLLNKCYQHSNMLFPHDVRSGFKHMGNYYELPEYSKIRAQMAQIDGYIEVTSTTTPTTTSPTTSTSTTTSSTSTTTTTTSAPLTTQSIYFEEIRSALLKETIQKIHDLESRVDAQLRTVEETCNSKIEGIKWEAENEMRKLNKTIRFMTKRIYRFGKAEYIYVDDKESWYSAEEQCEKWGGHLASIADAAENRFLRDIHKWFAWIGLNDIQKENKYVWSDRSSFRFKNWKKGQPDNADYNENCAEMGPDGMWIDSFCMAGRHYICKRI
uniref:C-type lectin domain-containing protein n=2 Tax=Ascaris TaxID=6251 RepID=A0A0M3ICV3_ASCLU